MCHLQISSITHVALSFLVMVPFAVQLLFAVVPLVYFCFWCHIPKNHGKNCCQKLTVFSSGSIRVSILIFRFVIHFEFITVHGVGQWWSFTLLHMAI